MLSVPIRQLDPDLPLPAYAHPGDAGLDLRAREDAVIAPAGGRSLIPTGIAIAIPAGHAGFVMARSGLALRHGIGVRDEARWRFIGPAECTRIRWRSVASETSVPR